MNSKEITPTEKWLRDKMGIHDFSPLPYMDGRQLAKYLTQYADYLEVENSAEGSAPLKDLEGITDEDAKELVKILSPDDKIRNVRIEEGFIYWERKLKYSYTKEAVAFAKLSSPNLKVVAYQFLQSRGYSLPQYYPSK